MKRIHKLGRNEQSDLPANVRRTLQARRGVSQRARTLRARYVRRRRPALSAADPRRDRIRVANVVRAQSVLDARARAERFRTGVHRHRRCRFQRGSHPRRNPQQHVHLDQHGAQDRVDRRHALRGRDQEVGLHAHELPDAATRRAADALFGERRRGGRQRDLLRPFGHGQNDAVGRFEAAARRR